MPQVRMFRDRMVSMEQTLERGEKHLDFLKALCREVFPEFEYREHVLDHERDLFVMLLEAPDGRRKSGGWTRMVLFDAERLPALIESPSSPLAVKLKDFLRERALRPDIVVTFRHLEEGWSDTPEPRREKRRRRGRGRSQDKRGEPHPQRGRPPQPGARPPAPASRPPAAPGRPGPSPGPRPVSAAEKPSPSGAAPGSLAGEGRRRRRRFRRRRGRGGPPGAPRPSPGPTQGS